MEETGNIKRILIDYTIFIEQLYAPAFDLEIEDMVENYIEEKIKTINKNSYEKESK